MEEKTWKTRRKRNRLEKEAQIRRIAWRPSYLVLSNQILIFQIISLPLKFNQGISEALVVVTSLITENDKSQRTSS